MVDFIKKKIVEKLARYTKHLKPSDISLSFLSGKGHLSNLELNGDVLSEALQLPPWLVISKVICDTIRARVPFTSINTDPVNFYVGQVLIEISTSTHTTATTTDSRSMKLLDQFGSNPSKYSLIDKVIDGMRIEIHSILVYFKDPLFHAQLQLTDILIESTSWEWKIVPLSKARVRIEDEDSVINYKVCRWSGLKVEGWSTASTDTSTHNQLRLIAGPSTIFVTFKRNVSDSSIMSTRVVVSLGDLVWVLTQFQLRAVSRLVQSLMDAAVRTYQLQRGDSDKESEGSIESVSTDKPVAPNNNSGERKKTKRKSKASSAKDKAVQERIEKYREGKLNFPPYEVVQNSFHFKTGKVDLQLCDDIGNAAGTDTVRGSMLIEVLELVVDVYLDQSAGVGRAHWNKANDCLNANTSWSRKLIATASKTQFVDLPSVNLSYLRERSVIVRCDNFSVGALMMGDNKQLQTSKQALPILTSDKSTFHIPNDLHNPAVQVGVSLYFYPDNKFLVPRPNVMVYLSPIHLNLHQESCLWLVEFVHGVVRTVNIELALSVKDEGQSFLEAQSVQAERLPGVDLELKILFTKVTLPLAGAADDGRPKVLQIETASIKARNCPINELLGNSHFSCALEALREGWVISSQDNAEFPHFQNDLRALPTRLQELLQQQVRTGRKRGESDDSTASSPSSTGLAPEENKSEMVAIEGWHISTACVHVAFADNYTHQATLHTKTFINDFPLHLWLFLPPSPLDASVPSQPPSLTHFDILRDPRFSLLAYAPSEIRVELERLQLLFLMRLKDSFDSFKSSLMKFLDPDTFAPHLKETLEAHRLASKDAVTPPATISGCIVVRRVEASFLLPTLCTTTNTTNQSPDQGDSVVTPSEAIATAVAAPGAGVKTTSRETTPTGDTEEEVTTPPQVNELQHAPGGSPTSSRSLTASPLPTSPSTSSQVSLEESAITGSMTSLPVILECRNQVGNLRYGSTSNVFLEPKHTLPSRSHSAVELLPHKESVVTGGVRHIVTGGNNTDSMDKNAKDKSISEEEFVIVDSPQSMPYLPTLLTHPKADPIVGIESSSAGTSLGPSSPSTCSSDTGITSPSDRRQKTPTPPRTKPQFILHAQVQHIFAVPNIKAGEISVRLSADHVALRELSSEEYQGMKEMRNRKENEDSLPSHTPSIKARLEVGDQVGRFYPKDCAEKQDIILVTKIEGLDISLLLPNIAIMKDFFDDEYETLLPLPLHLKVLTTRAVLVEDLSHSADHEQSMRLGVEQLEVHKGRELCQEADIFMEQSLSAVPRCGSVDPSQAAQMQEDEQQLMHSFSEFISVFECHVQHYGRLHLPGPSSQHIAGLLKELQAALIPVKPSRNASPPPTYAEVAVPFSYLQSSARRSSSELLHLRRENEQLRQVQRHCERLSAQLKESQVEMERRDTDLVMVTDECRRTKDQLVSYKQVMERQQEHIERLLTENFNLQTQLYTP